MEECIGQIGALIQQGLVEASMPIGEFVRMVTEQGMMGQGQQQMSPEPPRGGLGQAQMMQNRGGM